MPGIGAALACLGALLIAAPASAEVRAVTSSADSGAGSLRAVVAAAGAGDVVQIANGVNPVLTSGEIDVTRAIAIRGQGASRTTVSAGGASRIFDVSSGGVSIQDLALSAGGAADGADGGSGISGSAGDDGGAILNRAGGGLVLRRMLILRSSAGDGGTGGDTLLPLLSPGAGGAGGRGGAIASFGSLALDSVALWGNRAGNGGAPGSGGLEEAPGGDGGTGGAIFIAGGAGRSTSLSNVTISGNAAGNAGSSAAAGRGGGIYADGGGGPGSITINHATIAGNRTGSGASPSGGGLAATTSAGVLVVRNSILAANTASGGANCSGASIGDGGHNIAFPAGGCPASFSNANPNLDNDGIADNGGPTPTIAIGAGAALNAVPASGAGCAETDQRGIARPQGPACDIGAYEHRAPSCEAVNAGTRPGRKVKISLSCSGPGGITYLMKSGPRGGKLGRLNEAAGTITYRAGRRFRGTDTFTYAGTNLVGESAPATVTVTVSGPFPPPNKFRFGKVRLNRNKGTAKLPVRVPGPGKIKLRGKTVRNVTRKPGKAKSLKLPIRPTKKARKKLKRRGVTTVKAKVRFKPRGGFARTRTKKIRLRTNSFFVPIKL